MMTTGKLTGVIKNPNTTCTKLAELMHNYDLTIEQAELMAQHPRAETDLLQDLWNEFCEFPAVAAAIATRVGKLNNQLLEDIAETLTRNIEAWEEQEWENVMDAFKNTIRTEFLTQYYNLLDYTFLETEEEDDDDYYDCNFMEDNYSEFENGNDDYARGDYEYDSDTDSYYDEYENELDYVEGAIAEAWDDAMEE